VFKSGLLKYHFGCLKTNEWLVVLKKKEKVIAYMIHFFRDYTCSYCFCTQKLKTVLKNR